MVDRDNVAEAYNNQNDGHTGITREKKYFT